MIFEELNFLQPIAAGAIFLGLIFVNLNVFSQEETYNNQNRFLRWSENNELVFSVEEGAPHYASKVLLQTKQDNEWDKWSYDEENKQIIGINDYCLGVGGAYEIMLKDCSETLVNTTWHFDENGRLVGVVNVTGSHEAMCTQGEIVDDRIEMKFVNCSDDSTMKFELEGTKKTLGIEEIILVSQGKQRDSIFNEITNNQDLEELEKAVKLLGFEEILRNQELTIFAPSDEAFDKLGDKVSQKLRREENREILAKIISYHAVPGLYGSEHISGLDKLINVNGDEVDIDLENGSLIDSKANVTTPDWSGRNGIVHVIDHVLIPDDLDLSTIIESE